MLFLNQEIPEPKVGTPLVLRMGPFPPLHDTWHSVIFSSNSTKTFSLTKIFPEIGEVISVAYFMHLV